MKYIIAILFALSMSACSSLRPADYADSATTAVSIANGATELNPVVGAAGDSAAPVMALGTKVVVRSLIDNSGLSEQEKENAHNIVSSVGWGASCNNLAVIAGATGYAAPAIGLICAIISYNR